MKNIVIIKDGESFVELSDVIKYSGNTDAHIKSVIRAEMETLLSFGLVYLHPLQEDLNYSEMKFNEQSAAYLMTLMQNTTHVKQFKRDLIHQFFTMRQIITEKLCAIHEKKEIKLTETIEQAQKEIKTLAARNMKTYRGGRVSLRKYLKLNTINLKEADAWLVLIERELVNVQEFTVIRKMLVDEDIGEQDGTGGIKFDRKALDGIFIKYAKFVTK